MSTSDLNADRYACSTFDRKVSSASGTARRALGIALLAAVGCAGAPATAPPSELSARASASASAPSAAAASASASPSAATPTVPLEEAWAWVRTHAPEASVALSLEAPETLRDRLLDWAPPDGSLRVWDLACREHRLTRGERTLSGPAHVSTRIEGNVKHVHEDRVEIGWDVVFVCGADATYTRSGGVWTLSDSSASGCMSTPSAHISKLTADAAWFGGSTVTISLQCKRLREEVQHCRAGGTRTCAVCDELGLSQVEESSKRTSGHVSSKSSHNIDDADCSAPCPPDPIGDKIPALDNAFKDQRLLLSDPDVHPTLFRTQAACQSYRRKTNVPADAIQTW
jgi:hypothetical protein